MSIKSRSVAVVSVGVMLAVGALVWFWMGGEGIVGETLAIQRQLLNGEVSGRDRQAGLRLITRNVDRMDRDDVQAVRAALTADWRRMQQAGIEEYFAADGGDQRPCSTARSAVWSRRGISGLRPTHVRPGCRHAPAPRQKTPLSRRRPVVHRQRSSSKATSPRSRCGPASGAFPCRSGC